MNTDITTFPTEVQVAFESLFSPGVSYYEKNEILNNGEMRVITDFNSVMQCTLVLKNADCNISGDEIEIHFEEARLYQKDGRYFIDADYLNFENDNEEGTLTIGFDSAEVQYEFFWHPDTYRSIGPWENLFQLAADLKDKCDLAPAHCNEKETALLPLLTELDALNHYRNETLQMPILKAHFLEQNCSEIVAKLDSIEKEKAEKMLYKHIRRLQNALNDAKYEAVWRELFDEIQDSQADYPRAEAAPQQLALRDAIGAKMKKNGYEGNYPDFYRVNNRMVYHVNFHDYYIENENASYSCYCGRMPLGKNGEIGDIRSCMFRDKNKRFFAELHFDFSDWSGEQKPQDIDKSIRIAIKKAQHEKLTKEEKSAIYETGMKPAEALISALLIALLTVVIGIPIFLIIASIITLIFLGPGGVTDMLREIPWWKYTLGVFLGLWAATSIYFVLPMKRY